jgi:hypothetical protein
MVSIYDRFRRRLPEQGQPGAEVAVAASKEGWAGDVVPWLVRPSNAVSNSGIQRRSAGSIERLVNEVGESPMETF